MRKEKKSRLTLAVGPLELTPCCPALTLPLKKEGGIMPGADGRKNKWEYSGEQEAPMTHYTYDTLKVHKPYRFSHATFRTDAKREERILCWDQAHTPLDNEGAFFRLLLEDKDGEASLQFLRYEKNRWVRVCGSPRGNDYFYIPRSHFAVVVDERDILPIDLDEATNRILFHCPDGQMIYKAHISDDQRQLLVVLCDEKTDKQSFWVHALRTGTALTLKEGSNEVSAVIAESLRGTVFPIDLSSVKPKGIIKSSKVKID